MNTNELAQLIRIGNALEGGSTSSGLPLTPSFTRTTQSGTIASGAKYISIAVKSGSGTILGTVVDTDFEGIDFPYNSSGWGEIPYTVDVWGEFVIITGR